MADAAKPAAPAPAPAKTPAPAAPAPEAVAKQGESDGGAEAAKPEGEAPASEGDDTPIETVLISSPSAFRVTEHHGVDGSFDVAAGINRVPAWVAEHWYALAHGVEEVTMAVPVKKGAAAAK